MKETLPSMRVTNVNLAKVYANNNFIWNLELPEIDLQNRPANDCVHNFTRLIQKSIKVMERKQHCHSAKNKFPCNKWFDDECKIAERCFKKSARLYSRWIQKTVLYQHFWQERRAYKSLTRKKKRQATILLHNELIKVQNK